MGCQAFESGSTMCKLSTHLYCQLSGHSRPIFMKLNVTRFLMKYLLIGNSFVVYICVSIFLWGSHPTVIDYEEGCSFRAPKLAL